MRSNAVRMQAAVDFVTANPGATAAAVTAHLLDVLDERARSKATAYKQAQGVVERVVRDRLVRQDPSLRLHPWDARRRTFADLLERAAFAAPDQDRFRETMRNAADAWRYAGDENRARVLENIAAERGLPPRSSARSAGTLVGGDENRARVLENIAAERGLPPRSSARSAGTLVGNDQT